MVIIIYGYYNIWLYLKKEKKIKKRKKNNELLDL